MTADTWVDPANDLVRAFRDVAVEAFARGMPACPRRPSWLESLLGATQVSESDWGEAGRRFHDLFTGVHGLRGRYVSLEDALRRTIAPLPLAARNGFWAVFGQVALIRAVEAARPRPSLEARGKDSVIDALRPSNDIVPIVADLCRRVQLAASSAPIPGAWLWDSAARSCVSPEMLRRAATLNGAFYDRSVAGESLDAVLRETIDRADMGATALVWAHLGRAFFAAFAEAGDPFPERRGIYVPRARIDPEALVELAFVHHGEALGLIGPSGRGEFQS